jgi:heat shock protein HslJ
MKKTAFLLIPALMLALVSFSGCEKKVHNTELIFNKWKLVSFVNESDGTTKIPAPNSFGNYWIEFKQNNTLSGVSSTNNFTATFAISNGNLMTITDLGGTEINELGDGELFVECLMSAFRFSVTETELKLYYSENNYLLLNLYQQ